MKFGSFRKQGLHRFLRFIERLREGDGDFGEAPVLSEASDVVRIMSVHKSKGLEFPVVIAAGLGGMLRRSDGGPVQVHRDLHVGLSVADLGRNIYYPSAATLCIREAAKRAATAEELRLLDSLNCDAVQGWHIAQPMPSAEATGWLRARTTMPLDLVPLPVEPAVEEEPPHDPRPALRAV